MIDDQTAFQLCKTALENGFADWLKARVGQMGVDMFDQADSDEELRRAKAARVAAAYITDVVRLGARKAT